MKQIGFLAAALVLAGCGSGPGPQQAQQQAPAAMQVPQQGVNPAPPVVVAEQPYPAPPAPEGSVPPGSQQQPAPPPAQTDAPPAQHAELLIPSGTSIRVRIDRTLDTRRNRPGDRFGATLMDPVQENGRVLVPRGTVFSGHVTTAQASGRMKGRASLGVTLDSFEINGARYPVATTAAGRVSARHKKRNLVLIGGGSGLGALIGGLAGGGRGALIGAGAGAGAGAAGAAFTGKKQVSIPAETVLTFRLDEGVEL
jgi:hypothetical protein